MKAIIVFIIIVLGALFFLFYKPQFKTEFDVTRIALDTTFQNPIWNGSDGYGRHISLRAVGDIDSPTEVFVKDPDYLDKFLLVQLPQGKFDTTWIGEYYEKKAEVVYLHKKATKGHMKIIFRYLTPDTDTLAQVE